MLHGKYLGVRHSTPLLSHSAFHVNTNFEFSLSRLDFDVFHLTDSAILILQCLISSLLNSPLMPLLGSAAFLSSYPRPIKFWEKNYNTKRLDNTNVQLQAQINEFHCGLDDNNLNAIFYEHLTRVLQTSLCGEVQLGREFFSFVVLILDIVCLA